MIQILVDTDVLIDYSKGFGYLLGELLQRQTDGEAELYVNPVIVAEFFTDQKLRNKRKQAEAEDFLNLFGFKEINRKMGQRVGELLREKRVDFLGDAFIAATCLADNLVLATKNRKHFNKVPQLKFYSG